MKKLKMLMIAGMMAAALVTAVRMEPGRRTQICL